MMNFNELNLKLLVISNNQKEIGEKWELWNEKQCQINKILAKQYILSEKKEIVQRIIQFLIKKITKISNEIGKLNQEMKLNIEEIITLIQPQKSKRKADVLCWEPKTSPKKKIKIDSIQPQCEKIPTTRIEKNQILTHGSDNENIAGALNDCELESIRYPLDLRVKGIRRTIEYREIPEHKKINCKTK